MLARPSATLGYRRKSPPPRPLGPTEVPEAIVRTFPPELLRRFAEESGFIERERRIDPVAFFLTLTLDFGVGLQRSLALLKRGYEQRAQLELELAYSSWHGRFTPELATFLRLCVAHGLSQLKEADGPVLAERLSIFEDILIKDSSVVRLHAKLATLWPATRSKKVAAGVKVDTMISVRAHGPKSLALVGERTPDVKLLRPGPWVKNRLLLFDLGYYSHRLFAKIGENGGSFLSRLKANADPVFVRSLKVHRGRALELEGKRLSEVLPRLEREVLDAEVEIAFQRREYRGKRRGDSLTCRLVGVWDAEHGEYHLYVTNVSAERLTAEELAELYSLRWQIELTFKELKSYYALDQITTTKAEVVESLLWASLLTLIVSRRIYNLVRSREPEELRARYTPLRWAAMFRQVSAEILRRTIAYLDGKRGELRDRKNVNLFLTQEALDPHVNRHRLQATFTT
jgi:putative transposase